MKNDIRGNDAGKYWGDRANTYGNQYGLNTPTNALKVQRKVALMLDGINADVVLELGCGTGIFTKEFARRFPNMTATDISNDMVKVACSNNPDVNILVLDARDMPSSSKICDLVLATYLFQHTDTVQILNEIHRVLKDNGKLVALVPNILNPIHYARARCEWTRKLLKENSHSIDYTRKQWVEILHNRGFECEVTPIEFTSPYVGIRLAKISMRLSSVLEKMPIVKEFAGTLLIKAWKK